MFSFPHVLQKRRLHYSTSLRQYVPKRQTMYLPWGPWREVVLVPFVIWWWDPVHDFKGTALSANKVVANWSWKGCGGVKQKPGPSVLGGKTWHHNEYPVWSLLFLLCVLLFAQSWRLGVRVSSLWVLSQLLRLLSDTSRTVEPVIHCMEVEFWGLGHNYSM